MVRNFLWSQLKHSEIKSEERPSLCFCFIFIYSLCLEICIYCVNSNCSLGREFINSVKGYYDKFFLFGAFFYAHSNYFNIRDACLVHSREALYSFHQLLQTFKFRRCTCKTIFNAFSRILQQADLDKQATRDHKDLSVSPLGPRLWRQPRAFIQSTTCPQGCVGFLYVPLKLSDRKKNRSLCTFKMDSFYIYIYYVSLFQSKPDTLISF